jgi:hypothetical protein
MRSNDLRCVTARRAPVDRHGRTARHLDRAKGDFEYLQWREWERKPALKPAASRAR